jgi:hypothetical protein
MSTYITVTSGTGALVTRVKQVQQANREAQLQSDRDKALQAKVTAEVTEQTAQAAQPFGGNPDTSVEKRPAAFGGSTFVPLAINWRGAVVTTEDSYTTGLSYRYEVYTNTLAVCTPNPVSLSVAGKSLVQVPQDTHVSTFGYRVSNLPNNFSDQSGRGNIVSVQYQAGSTVYPLAPAPILPVNRIAPTSFQPSIVVATKGKVLFAAMSLPPEPSTFDSRMSYYPWLDSGNPVNTLIDDYPFDIEHSTAVTPWRGLATSPYFGPAGRQVPTPYMFFRIQGSVVQRRSAVHRHPESFGDFYAANAFADDPSKDMRGIYAGEVRVSGQRARFLRLKNTETGLYQDFPFGDLRTFVSPVTGLPVIAAPYELVVHTHQLPAYSTPAELAEYLDKCVDPNSAGGLYIGPSIERRQRLPASFFAATAAKLDKTGPDTLTDDSFFLVLL